MAFTTAAGYGNLPSGNFVPVIYSQKVLKFFRRASVAEAITNTDYAGEIENFGDTVNIIKEPTITVNAYQRGSTVNTEALADDQIQLVVDQGNYFAFKVDDIEERHSHLNFEALATSSGAYTLKKAYDYNVLKNIADNAATPSGTLATHCRHKTSDTEFLLLTLSEQRARDPHHKAWGASVDTARPFWYREFARV